MSYRLIEAERKLKLCLPIFLPRAHRQLVEQGKLDLDDPAGKYVPEIDEMKMLDGSKPNKKITVRMLLSHTAGFSYTVGILSNKQTILRLMKPVTVLQRGRQELVQGTRPRRVRPGQLGGLQDTLDRSAR